MKEQLVEMTGLTPRVIRVWFQNKRCKDKKKTMQMKLQIQQEKVNNQRPSFNYDDGRNKLIRRGNSHTQLLLTTRAGRTKTRLRHHAWHSDASQLSGAP